MTVYKIGCDKIKITLTHSEVLSYFGNYESIAYPTGDTKLAMNTGGISYAFIISEV